MFFTQEDYKKIELYLKLKAKKDTDFQESQEINNTDWLTLIKRDGNNDAQHGNHQNVIIQIKYLMELIFEGLVNGDLELMLLVVDNYPTENSSKLVRSHGIWEEISAVREGRELLAVTLDISPDIKLIEIDGTNTNLILSGGATMNTYGKSPLQIVNPSDMTSKLLLVYYNDESFSFINAHINNNKWEGTYTVPNKVGKYTVRFSCTYNDTLKSNSSIFHVNLRKYFGFSNITPVNPTSLGVSDFSDTVECIVNIPATNNGFQHIYFAVPNEMTISKIEQVEGAYLPLDFHYVSTISRTINGELYNYKLYESGTTHDSDDGFIDSSVSKRLKIS